jgi:hypothetical protein
MKQFAPAQTLLIAGWSDIDDIDPKSQEPSYMYLASKSISDKLVWKASEKYTNVDFAVVRFVAISGDRRPFTFAI